MTRLPILSARELIAALERSGFRFAHRKGSHLIYRKRVSPEKSLVVVVPEHREIRRGTLAEILRRAELSIDELLGRRE